MTLSQSLLGLKFKNPLVIAAGKWVWEGKDLQAAVKSGAGAVTTKSLWGKVHEGNPEPVFARNDHWTLNAVGLPDRGREHSEEQLRAILPAKAVPVITSVVGLSKKDYVACARWIAGLRPSAIEINLSSPTFLKLKGAFFDTEEAASIVPAVKEAAGGLPVFVKLSPNIPDIGSFAARCVAAGADGITAINTLGTGLAIDLQTRKPILSAKRGGLSGPGIKPLAVRCVAEIYDATGGKVPIIGVGGVTRGEDVVEMLLAGASLVGLASAVLGEGMGAVQRILDEFTAWCEAHGVKKAADLVGGMQRE